MFDHHEGAPDPSYMLINVRLAFWVVNFAKKINVAKIGNPDTCLARV